MIRSVFNTLLIIYLFVCAQSWKRKWEVKAHVWGVFTGHTHEHTHSSQSQRSTAVALLDHSPYYFLRYCLLLNLEIMNWLGWLGVKHHKSLNLHCLVLFSTELQVCIVKSQFYMCSKVPIENRDPRTQILMLAQLVFYWMNLWSLPVKLVPLFSRSK